MTSQENHLNIVGIHLRCERVIACVGDLARAEFIGMYFKSPRIYLCCGLVVACAGALVRAELTVVYFESLGFTHAVKLARSVFVR